MQLASLFQLSVRNVRWDSGAGLFENILPCAYYPEYLSVYFCLQIKVGLINYKVLTGLCYINLSLYRPMPVTTKRRVLGTHFQMWILKKKSRSNNKNTKNPKQMHFWINKRIRKRICYKVYVSCLLHEKQFWQKTEKAITFGNKSNP